MHWRLGCAFLAILAAGPGCGDGRCPRGTTFNGRSDGDRHAQWCEIATANKPRKHGRFREWNLEGRLMAEGQYDNGRQVGRWQAWYPTGQLHHDAEIPDGLRITYHANGRQAGVRQFNGQLRVGHWQEWYEDGTPRLDAWYPDGWSIEWHSTGVKHAEGGVRDGERFGTWWLYSAAGLRAGMGRYVKGKENGIFLNYARENEPARVGQPIFARIFTDGSMTGNVPAADLAALAADCDANGFEKCCENHPLCKRWRPYMTDGEYKKPGAVMPKDLLVPPTTPPTTAAVTFP